MFFTNSENILNRISGNGLWSEVAKATGRCPARIYTMTGIAKGPVIMASMVHRMKQRNFQKEVLIWAKRDHAAARNDPIEDFIGADRKLIKDHKIS